MPFYATANSDENGYIEKDAYIELFKTEEEAERFLIESVDPEYLEENDLKIEIVVGRFSDYWVKTIGSPVHMGSAMFYPFFITQLYIQKPGMHPGGNQYWSTPKADILVVVLKKKDQ